MQSHSRGNSACGRTCDSKQCMENINGVAGSVGNPSAVRILYGLGQQALQTAMRDSTHLRRKYEPHESFPINPLELAQDRERREVPPAVANLEKYLCQISADP